MLSGNVWGAQAPHLMTFRRCSETVRLSASLMATQSLIAFHDGAGEVSRRCGWGVVRWCERIVARPGASVDLQPLRIHLGVYVSSLVLRTQM
jgi:hypothetical protein